MKFAKPRLMRWNASSISDHNRSELQIDYDLIENRKRMADGTMRKQLIVNKHKFSCSWDMLPHSAAFTVDKYFGANDMETFWKNNQGAFTLELSFGSSPVETYQVMFSEFTKTLQKRGAFDFYSVNVSMEEV